MQCKVRSASSHVISVVVPVYRNAETLDELHRRVRDVLEAGSLEYEMVFVDDACPEGSLTVLEEVVRRDPRVTVLALRRNVGQQLAVLAGLAQARGTWVVVMDADLQDPPEAIPRLLTTIQEGFGAVFAGRRGRHEPVFRWLTSHLFKWILHIVCGTPTDAGLYVAMSHAMVERLLAFDEPGPSVVAMVGCAGLPVTSIPVRRARRSDGRSAYSEWKRLKMSLLALTWILSWKWRSRVWVSSRGSL